MQAFELSHNIDYSKKKKFYSHIKCKFSQKVELINNIVNNNDQKNSSFIILRSRMIDLLHNNYLELKNDDIINLSDILADSRNYYTHYNDSKRNKCAVNDNLKYSIFIIKVLLECIILEKLGFNEDYILNKKKDDLNFIKTKKMVENIIKNDR